jgi:hypothetical protein
MKCKRCGHEPASLLDNKVAICAPCWLELYGKSHWAEEENEGTTMANEMKTKKGVNYYSDYTEARDIANKLTKSARVVSYTTGWAVQYYVSGPYYPAPTREQHDDDE